MGRVKEKYSRRKAEHRFARVYLTVGGDRCIYCGMPNDGRYDHQPPVYVLHRFADGRLVTAMAIRKKFGQCKLVPCCTICNMGLGAYHDADDTNRRKEIVNWFLQDDRYPEDRTILEIGYRLLDERAQGKRGVEIYEFTGVGRVIYSESLLGFIEGEFKSPDDFPSWLTVAQSELAEWLRGARNRKSRYFLDMANLKSYALLPHARDDPRGQIKKAAGTD